jgi:hypothetical protein
MEVLPPPYLCSYPFCFLHVKLDVVLPYEQIGTARLEYEMALPLQFEHPSLGYLQTPRS